MGEHMENPAVQGGALSNVTFETDRREYSKKPRKSKGLIVNIDTAKGDDTVVLKGRPLWALRELIAAGPQGVTPIEKPAPRWAAYVHSLRGVGIEVETIHEPHGGPYAGHHARYRLVSRVQIGGAA